MTGEPTNIERLRRETIAWIAVLAAGWVALAALHYGTRDADSRLYSDIAARMSVASPSGWIAPDFPPGWFMGGPFREHPVGIFVPAALLGRLGYPARQAAYALNALYQVLTIVLIQRLAAAVIAGWEARTLGWVIQLVPIAFTFRIRANHEQAVVLCLVVALLGTERAQASARWMVLIVAGLAGLLLVKGLFAVFGPALCVLWLLARRWAAPPPRPSQRAAWLGIALGVLAMGVVAGAYEYLYRAATGSPFWSFYLTRQLGVAAATESGVGIGVKLYNFVWYLSRVVWFAFPWSLAFAVALWRARSSLRRSSWHAAPNDGGSRAGLAFVLATLVLYVGVFILSDRRADRYIFPVYFAVAAAGSVAALRALGRFRDFARGIDRPWLAPAVWAIAFSLHLFAGRLGVPTVKIWGPGP